MTDHSPGDGEFSRGVGDSYREAGWGFGHTIPELEVRSMPTPFPLIGIDYIFHSGDIRVRRSQRNRASVVPKGHCQDGTGEV